MPKPRHDNPYAERRIVELDLPRWQSRRELDALATERGRRERLFAELSGVAWESLSPAELAFRYMLRAAGSPLDSLRGELTRWCAAVRSGEACAAPARRDVESDAEQVAEDWRHMTPAERAYANWAENKRE